MGAPQIHPTAIVDPQAALGDDVEVAPYALVEGPSVIGARTKIGPRAFVGRHTTLGEDNVIEIGAVIGQYPQDMSYTPCESYLRVGNRNTFREYVVIHRAKDPGGATIVGDDNFVMHQAHFGHDCLIGNHCIVGPLVLLAGHVTLLDQAYLAGASVVHQFCRIGRLAFLQGHGGVSMDLPPFCTAGDVNRLLGLNTVGMRRAGLDAPTRQAVKDAFRRLFRGGRSVPVVAAEIVAETQKDEVRELAQFCLQTERGVVGLHEGRNGWAAGAATT